MSGNLRSNTKCSARYTLPNNQWVVTSSRQDISVQFAAMIVNRVISVAIVIRLKRLRAKRYHRSRTPQGQVAAKTALSVPGVHIEPQGQLPIERPTHRWELRPLGQRDQECVSRHLLSNSPYQQVSLCILLRCLIQAPKAQ